MKYVSADEAMALVKSGDWVFFQGSTSVPVILQEALERRHEELRDVKIVSGFNVTKGPAPFCKPEYRDAFEVESLFLCADQREYVAQGYGSLIPGFLSDLPKLIRRGEIPIDVACINCSLPDEDGYCSYNISADLAQPAVDVARVIIAQINKSVPYLYGTAMIHESKITAAVAEACTCGYLQRTRLAENRYRIMPIVAAMLTLERAQQLIAQLQDTLAAEED